MKVRNASRIALTALVAVLFAVVAAPAQAASPVIKTHATTACYLKFKKQYTVQVGAFPTPIKRWRYFTAEVRHWATWEETSNPQGDRIKRVTARRVYVWVGEGDDVENPRRLTAFHRSTIASVSAGMLIGKRRVPGTHVRWDNRAGITSEHTFPGNTRWFFDNTIVQERMTTMIRIPGARFIDRDGKYTLSGSASCSSGTAR